MTKIKPLLPSLRERKRYLVFEIISKNAINTSPEQDIMDASTSYLGQMGMAKAGLLVLNDKYNKKTQQGIIRVNHKMVDHVRASLCFIKTINNEQVIVRSKGVSGILKKAQEKFMAS